MLRVLQDGTFERVGSVRTLHSDVRVIAATNRDLERAMTEGRFREDLYYRLNVFPITLPPLRARREDIPLLVWSVISRRQRDLGREITDVPKRVMQSLSAYDWPGNVRELENVIERALILSRGSTLHVEDLAGGAAPAAAQAGSPFSLRRLDDVERDHIRGVLERCGWRVNGDGQRRRRARPAPEHAALQDEEAGHHQAAAGRACRRAQNRIKAERRASA